MLVDGFKFIDHQQKAETEMSDTVIEYDESDVEYEEGEYYEYEEETDTEEPGSEVAVVEHIATVVDYTPLTERQAKSLDNKIRKASEKVNATTDQLFGLLEEAANGRIHEALGFPSWTAWFSDAVQIRPNDRDERKAFAALMSGRGMSQRAIAAALGVSQKTVDRDLEGESLDSGDSETVTALDGSEHPRTKAKRQKPIDAEVISVEEEARSAADTVSDFGNEIDTLLINVQAFKDVLADELFPKARKRIGQRFVKRLDTAITDLAEILEEIRA